MDVAGKAASETVSTVSREAKDLLDRQVGRGASLLGSVGSSVEAAARDLEQKSPQMAGFVRTVGTRIDDYATELQGQTVDGVVRSVSDLTRRQPALVFGLAALAGFLVFRTFKSAPPSTAVVSDSGTQGRTGSYQSTGSYGTSGTHGMSNGIR